MTEPLPTATAAVDEALAALDDAVDWLHYLSPLHNDALWHDFIASDGKVEPELCYPPVGERLLRAERDLAQVSTERVQHPLIRELLSEKKRELELQIKLIGARDQVHFRAVSIELFGGIEPSLLAEAERLLRELPCETPLPEDADAAIMAACARAAIENYQQQAPDLDAEVRILEDLNSSMMVHKGHLEIAASARIAHARVMPLVAHEVGTHVLTRYNGARQPLKQLAVGLAHYDSLQEGLGALAEYLAGYLPASRLRVLAARVVAAALALDGAGVTAIVAHLTRDYGLDLAAAFDTAVRARRGGGLTKDAVYLRGLQELLAYFSKGGAIEPLLIGKFALAQRELINALLAEGVLAPAALLPQHLDRDGRERLARVRTLHLHQLYQQAPES